MKLYEEQSTALISGYDSNGNTDTNANLSTVCKDEGK